ncbi:hypothetical protein XENOCAPTIV_019259 [Xenoophorus captivus]|uniref:Uncharacterized protein n=1 Tax=Xenoophorus captivus TaxID=1517983 RepID=A0ABV0QSN2_9TELE
MPQPTNSMFISALFFMYAVLKFRPSQNTFLQNLFQGTQNLLGHIQTCFSAYLGTLKYPMAPRGPSEIPATAPMTLLCTLWLNGTHESTPRCPKTPQVTKLQASVFLHS